jgi:TRAP transporter 4TM/12TM fusion protein
LSAAETEAGAAPPSVPAIHPPAIHPGVRRLRSALAVLLTLGSLGWSAQVPSWFGVALFTEQFLSAMLGVALALVYIHYPARRRTERTRLPWYDSAAAFLGFGAGWYVAFAYPVLIKQLTGADLPIDALVVSLIFFVLCIEGLRRTVGYSLVIIVLIFVGYALIGHLVPGGLQTRRVGFGQLITYLSLDTSALMGLAMVVGTTIVLTFVFFGQLLLLSGGSTFFNDVSLLLMGRFRGGSAKIAITASSLFGSVSGVAVSNIVATGVVTIPMMKRAGFSPRFAASVEAVASTGGQLMPPVMGAVAFLMADFLEMPYREIVLAAIVPSLLYYVALFIQADFEAAKAGITRVDPKEISKARDVLRTGWMFILPFAGLIVALFTLNWEAEAAAILAAVVIAILFGNWLVFAVAVLLIGLYFALNWNGSTATVVGVALAVSIGLRLTYRGVSMPARALLDALIKTGLSVLDIIMIVAGAGFIIGVLLSTGLGFALTSLLVDFGSGNLLVLLLISGMLCIVLGMGMPTVGVYILLAVLVAPSLKDVGVLPLAGHMFILYLGMMSLITPPVAVAAFFAASIAKAPPMATGWYSMRFGWTAYVVPFLFVFSPSLLLQGSTADLVIDVSTAVAGVWLVSAAIAGYFARLLGAVDRLAFTLAGALLLMPRGVGVWVVWLNLAGLALGSALVAREVIQARKLRHSQKSGLAEAALGPQGDG